jgi:hypothetical protein
VVACAPVDNWGEGFPVVHTMGLLATMYVQASLVLVDFAGIYPPLALESPDRLEDLVTLRYISLLPNLPGSSSSVIIGFLDHGRFELRRVYGSHRILVGEGI